MTNKTDNHDRLIFAMDVPEAAQARAVANDAVRQVEDYGVVCLLAQVPGPLQHAPDAPGVPGVGPGVSL